MRPELTSVGCARETARPAPTISRALPASLLDFLAKEKAEDRYASVPELIRRAHQLGVIGPQQRVDRTSVWRACVRLGLPLRRVPAKQEADQRRFAYPHRLMMVLSDGKHFRAGPRRRKRVAVFCNKLLCSLRLCAQREPRSAHT